MTGLPNSGLSAGSLTGGRAWASSDIVVVSGLPRSGTSLMMSMLEAGGLPALTDGIRQADADNPEGYFEFERVKQLDKGDRDWLGQAQGRAIKVISALLEHLPSEYTYRVIFMHRRMEEILASQRKMLERRGEPASDGNDARLAAAFQKHLARVQAWLAAQPNIALLNVDYNALLSDPIAGSRAVKRFLDDGLDMQRMVAVVNPDLYRNRIP
jgi:hypothetical protein